MTLFLKIELAFISMASQLLCNQNLRQNFDMIEHMSSDLKSEYQI